MSKEELIQEFTVINSNFLNDNKYKTEQSIVII